jgi:hypothetical protein
MDELRLVRDVRPDYPLREPAELTAAGDPLLAAIGAQRAGRPGPHRSRRWRWAGGAAALVAAAAAGVVVLVLVTAAPGGRTGQPPAPGGEATGPVRAANVLHLAARAALREPAGVPRADQYVYTRTVMVGETTARETWTSVDGTHDGLIVQPESPKDPRTARLLLPGCRKGRSAVTKGGQVVPGMSEPCTASPAYRGDLPTDADAMAAYLEKNCCSGGHNLNAYTDAVEQVISEAYTTPAQRAALFEAAARIPGLTAVRDVTDGAGRHGVGVTWKSDIGGGRTRTEAIVFDSNTYRLLGTDNTAVLDSAVVDAVGQRG